ncbi:V-type ATPase, D subunit [Anaeromyxobacter dehalogenans 2CP-1]|uniref:V-type ATP synthase subunit D n=1 Tax=Anaeromyxobacter dehalogenans (strain ATCC BAA-258 / DSM 21875 / 2CP-1) TaxID=455488 RepID=VATD_ANAD2|nr:V-type ATP synthase subunit D [Anaeromyxobacter dehalogenans]B8JE33.1 RecName: Full=V-type ATP synthase subunit D; AltName: Full=V-ATPase subunit D [Anaeromyxobacter dehalogenans 2CP-1]ACL66098.1 V-type ATPase, D subunit [Anaeromyxobacter dehalogenans 2CP-1]
MSRAATTRMGLLEVRARRAVAGKGARLLRAKREVLASELWKLVHDVLEGRARLDEALHRAVKALELAKALEGEERLASLALPAARAVPLAVTVRRVWGVPTPSVAAPPLVRAADQRGSSPVSWGPSGADAARHHEESLEVLLTIASKELHLARLGEEIRETSRRINALEQLVLPALRSEASRIAAALDERDREDAVRLRRFRARHPRPA